MQYIKNLLGNTFQGSSQLADNMASYQQQGIQSAMQSKNNFMNQQAQQMSQTQQQASNALAQQQQQQQQEAQGLGTLLKIGMMIYGGGAGASTGAGEATGTAEALGTGTEILDGAKKAGFLGFGGNGFKKFF